MATTNDKNKNLEDLVNDYSSAPPELTVTDSGIGDTMGSSTGEEDNAVEAGGWQGTDDATSTAPSDFASSQPSLVHSIGDRPFGEDPTGRAYGGGLDPDEGGVTDITGSPVEESRNWNKDPV